MILRPAQAVNEQANMQTNILQAAGLYDPSKCPRTIELVSTRLVNQKPVSLLKEWMPMVTTNAKQPKIHHRTVFTVDEDIALIKRQAKVAKIYLIELYRSIRSFFPSMDTGCGQPIWIHGASDANTVAGLGFYEHAETPLRR